MLFSVWVGSLPIIDALFLADAVPALVYAIVAWVSPIRVVRAVTRLLAMIFAFVWITHEIQHIFHGRVELFHSSTEAEWYVYSVAWLAFAVAGFAIGLVRGNQWLRRALVESARAAARTKRSYFGA